MSWKYPVRFLKSKIEHRGEGVKDLDPSHGLKHLFKILKMFAKKKKKVYYLLDKYLISHMAAFLQIDMVQMT